MGETDRVFVNKTIRALYGSLEEFDQHIREGLRPFIRSISMTFTGELLMLFKMLSPYLLEQFVFGIGPALQMPNLSVGSLFLLVGAMLLKTVGCLSLIWIPLRFCSYTFRHQRAWWGVCFTEIVLLQLVFWC